MKTAYICAFASLSSLVQSQLLVPLHRGKSGTPLPPPLRADIDTHTGDSQQPLMDPVGPVVPPGSGKPPADRPAAPGPGSVMLSDVMGKDRSINIFAGFTRDIETVSQRLDDATQNSTVLAPLNSAVEALPRKPWEDPRDYNNLGADAYEGEDGQDRAHRNLRRFVEAHIIPASPWEEGQKVKAVDGGSRQVWWEEKDGVRKIQPDGIEVVNIASSVANGQVWIVKGVRNYA